MQREKDSSKSKSLPLWKRRMQVKRRPKFAANTMFRTPRFTDGRPNTGAWRSQTPGNREVWKTRTESSKRSWPIKRLNLWPRRNCSQKTSEAQSKTQSGGAFTWALWAIESKGMSLRGSWALNMLLPVQTESGWDRCSKWGWISSGPANRSRTAYIESFNGKFRHQCLNEHYFSTLEEAKRIIEDWRIHYNEFRPHSSLEGLTPNFFIRPKCNLLRG